MPNRPMPLWERNVRHLADMAERAGLPVVQCYALDLRDLLAELDKSRTRIEEFKAAAVSALGLAPSFGPTKAKGAGKA